MTPERSSRRVLLLVAQWGISLGALAYALSGVDMGTLWQALRGYAPSAMLAVLGVTALDYICMGFRLRGLLPCGASYTHSVQAVILCTGYNNILPAKAGDVVKVVYLTKKSRHPLLTIGSVILWERLLDVLALLCISLLAYTLADAGQRLVLPLLCCAGGAGLFYICRRWSLFFHAAYARFFPGRVGPLLQRLHSNVIDNVSAGWALRGFAWSLLIWGCYFASFVIALCSVAGFSLTFPQMLTVFAVTCLGMAVPSSPGGLGVFEGAMVLSLSWFGVDHSAALGIALFIHAVHFIPLAVIAVALNSRRGFWDGTRGPAYQTET